MNKINYLIYNGRLNKRIIINKLDRWADTKTQDQFNGIINKYFTYPVFIGIAVLIIVGNQIL